MFKDTKNGQTHFCEACEIENGGQFPYGDVLSKPKHTCGQPLQPSKEEKEWNKKHREWLEEETMIQKDILENGFKTKYILSKEELVSTCICGKCKNEPTKEEPESNEDWEERFDKIISNANLVHYQGETAVIKDFIRSTREEAKAETKKEIIEWAESSWGNTKKYGYKISVNSLKKFLNSNK